jgi:hypothetical protein
MKRALLLSTILLAVAEGVEDQFAAFARQFPGDRKSYAGSRAGDDCNPC